MEFKIRTSHFTISSIPLDEDNILNDTAEIKFNTYPLELLDQIDLEYLQNYMEYRKSLN